MQRFCLLRNKSSHNLDGLIYHNESPFVGSSRLYRIRSFVCNGFPRMDLQIPQFPQTISPWVSCFPTCFWRRFTKHFAPNLRFPLKESMRKCRMDIDIFLNFEFCTRKSARCTRKSGHCTRKSEHCTRKSEQFSATFALSQTHFGRGLDSKAKFLMTFWHWLAVMTNWHWIWLNSLFVVCLLCLFRWDLN